MKRLLATLTLIVCLSFPVLAGHVVGEAGYCDCNNPNGPHPMSAQSGDCGTVQDKNQDSTPDTELGLILILLATLLRIKV